MTPFWLQLAVYEMADDAPGGFPAASTPAPIATPETFWVIERRKYLDGMGFDKGRPVYATTGFRPGDHAYTQETGTAKQFPTREAATEWLRDVLGNNEAFEVHEHMMIARTSEIDRLTAERDEARAEAADLLRDLQMVDGGEEAMLGELRRAIAERDLARIALTSSNAEIERLKERLRSAEATVDTFMRAQEHYRGAMDERNTFKNAARAAEAQVAALTEQVRKLREALDHAEHLLRHRDRQEQTHRKFLMRDIEEALAGDLRSLRNRLELMKEGPVTIVQSDAALSPTEPEAMEK